MTYEPPLEAPSFQLNLIEFGEVELASLVNKTGESGTSYIYPPLPS